ncbi:MAG: hypothetical protein NT076_01145 [Candidatus Pacearchaeota archaeon]|nr:hypothetical protein [Candidatus Pacearchaeota archaeon]
MLNKEKTEISKKILILGILSIFLLIILINFSFAANETDVKFCCERTTYNAWCQNAPSSECSQEYRKTPTSCEATSFCKLGCCYDSQEGICMENTPEKVCSVKNGTWADDKQCDIPQCNYGCCVIGTQAAFVTLTRCKKLSSFYGLLTDFRPQINNELSCVSLASLSDEGACVYEVDYGARTCKFTSRQECNSLSGKTVSSGLVTGNMTFYKDYLCSNEELGVNCGPTQQTTCAEGKDEVYFLDSCGNLANIYDASKITDKDYWRMKVRKEDSCSPGSANSNSQTCGNCNYFLGSICKKGNAKYGSNICVNLDCKTTSDGAKKHGESWCSTDSYPDSVGSRYFRHLCINGEEIVEPCADFRQEICIQDDINGFSQAGCRPNRWQDCLSQTEKIDCENQDKRDCTWVLEGNKGKNITDIKTQENKSTNRILACVPLHAPGYKFWEEGEVKGVCGVGNQQCIVTYEERGLFWSSGSKPTDNSECLSDEWAQQQLSKCQLIGDCGANTNWLGIAGNKQGYKITREGRNESD